jgi:hypothetical protein
MLVEHVWKMVRENQKSGFCQKPDFYGRMVRKARF